MEKQRGHETTTQDQISGNCIVLDGQGEFPKTLKIRQKGEIREYTLRKTERGKFILNGK